MRMCPGGAEPRETSHSRDEQLQEAARRPPSPSHSPGAPERLSPPMLIAGAQPTPGSSRPAGAQVRGDLG